MKTPDSIAAAVFPGEAPPARRDADLAVVKRWLRDYVSEPSPQLGRSGPVCPFVPPALSQDTVRFHLRYAVDGRNPRQLTAVLVEEMTAFRDTVDPPGRSGRSLASLLVVLPNTGPTGWATLDRVYESLKDTAVDQGLMIGQFHPSCDERGARNAAFPVSRAPIALVAIRHMAPHDILFLHDRPDWFAAYRRRFAEVVDAGRIRDPLLRELYQSALHRHGLDTTGRPAHRRRRAAETPGRAIGGGSERSAPMTFRGTGSARTASPSMEGTSMSTTTTTLDPSEVGRRAAEILNGIQAHPGYERLTSSSMKYSTCWATFTGYPVVAEWSLDRDAGPLLTEALRVLALKAAVFELSGGDEEAAELLVPSPVDEMIHAVLAQFTVMTRMQIDLGVTFPHATELERFDYDRGCDTDVYYAAAGWGEQPLRYWLGSDEVSRRLAILNGRYGAAGFGRDGRSHDLDFAEPASAA